MVGLGCNPCKAEIISLAIDLGITILDTAELYDEREVGKGIKGKRDKVFLVSKVAPEHLNYWDVRIAVLGSLERLGTDHLDLYMIHWPNPKVKLSETLSAMNELKKMGLIRHIGLCNCDILYLREAMKCAKIDYVEVEYNLVDRTIENGLLPMCEANGIQILAYSPLKWTDYYWIMPIAGELVKTGEQVVLKYLQEQRVIPIPSTTNEQHLRDIVDTNFYMPVHVLRDIRSNYCGEPIYRNPSELMCNSKSEERVDLPADLKPIKIKDGVVVDGKVRFLSWVERYGDMPIPTLEV